MVAIAGPITGHRTVLFDRLCTPTPCSWNDLFAGPDRLFANRPREAAAREPEVRPYKGTCVLTNTETDMKSLHKLACLYLASAGIAFGATPVTITFDDLATGGYEYSGSIPNGYYGLQWGNFLAMDAPNFGPSGYLNGMVSANNVAYNWYGNPASLAGGLFDLNSAYLTAAWSDGLQVRVQGFVGTTLTYDNTYTLNTTAPTLINFNYLGIDKVYFYPEWPGGNWFVIDNLSITLRVSPFITTQPQDHTILGTSNVTFVIVAEGGQPLSYQWLFNGTNLDDTEDGHIVGSDAAMLHITNVRTNDQGLYQVVVSNEYGETNSVAAMLTVAGMKDVVPSAEYNALVDFYNATTIGRDWTNKDGWLDPKAYPWYGVSVTNIMFDADGNFISPGTVSGLELSGNKLNGSLPPDFVFLTHLQTLDLSTNNLSGSIPLGLSILTFTLQNLNLSSNAFTGSIPFDLGTLSKLGNVNLSYNQLNGQIPGLSGLFAATNLNLSYNKLGGSLTNVFLPTQLQAIDLSYNSITGSIPLGFAISSSATLQSLRLRRNSLTGGIPNSLPSLSQLQYLDLSKNSLTGSLGYVIVGSIARLQGLDLSDNRFSGSLQSLGFLTALTNLNLANNSLTGSIPVDVVQLGNLISMDLSDNRLSGSIPDMHTMASLEGLDLTDNNFDLVPTDSLGQANLNMIAVMTNYIADVAFLPQNGPSIITEPQDASVLSGTNFCFAVTVDGAPPFTYRWQRNGVDLPNDGRITGSQSSALCFSPVQLSDQATYQLIVTNAYDSATSREAVLMVTAVGKPPQITSPPVNLTTPAGATATFSVGVTGTQPLAYQWAFGGAALAGATNSGLVVPSVTLSNAGDYLVVITNSYGSTSAVPTLTVVMATPVVAWATAPIMYGTPLSSNQLCATANILGSYAY